MPKAPEAQPARLETDQDELAVTWVERERLPRQGKRGVRFSIIVKVAVAFVFIVVVKRWPGESREKGAQDSGGRSIGLG